MTDKEKASIRSEILERPIGEFIDNYKDASATAYNAGDFVAAVSLASKSATLMDIVNDEVGIEAELAEEEGE